MAIDLTAPLPKPEGRRRFSRLLGESGKVRQQSIGVLLSSATYVVYCGIAAVQVGYGLMAVEAAWALVISSALLNLLFFGFARSGLVANGPDPGLARTQLVVGVLYMFAGYAASGAAGPGMLIVMASHIVYAMFSMKPRDVWRLVGATMFCLALTMWACGFRWPERYAPGVQMVTFLYASLVVPLIAMLADRVTSMTQRLQSQRAELEVAMGKLKELATRDELTRLYNRHHMLEQLAAQREQHRRMKASMSVALIDLDHFKRINDQHGHAAGDDVLRQFALLARAHLRAMDLLARWGGEEFLVLLPNTNSADGLRALERLQTQLRNLSRTVMPHGLEVSFSAGVTLVAPDEPIEAAIDRADRAMYGAKTAGRGRSLAG